MNTLQTLLKGALGRKVPAEFAAENYDYEKALFDEIKKIAPDRFAFMRNKADIYELLSREWAEILPQSIEDALGLFCETIKVPQGSRLEFRVRQGHQRGKQFVTRATEAGNYETFRLDRDRFDVYPQAIGGAAAIDFERYLDGLEEMGEMYEILREGAIDQVFAMVQECLLASWNLAGRPAKNKVAVNGFDVQAMRELCNTIAPYGKPVIYCSPEFAAEMTVNYPDGAGMLHPQDYNDIHDRGYLGNFYGYPVIVLPQSFTDETNSKLVMNPSFAYVIPAGKEKLVKIGIEGDPQVMERQGRDWSTEIQGYAKIGVGMINRPNYWGIYYNAAIDAGEDWEAYNDTIVNSSDIKEIG